MKKNKPKLLALLLSILLLQVKSQTIEDAIRLSHAGKYDEAEKIFAELIEKDSKNVSLLIASGFNNAWNKKYTAARDRFNSALKIEPGNTEVAKGAAYTYLYKGNFEKASAAFRELLSANPSSEEFHFALALALLNRQQKNKAYAEFKKVLALNGSNEEAKKIMTEIRSGRKLIEFSVLGGWSVSNGGNKFGLRQAQAGYHVNNEVFIYARYDNSLAQDNYFFLRNNYNSTTFLGGVYARWHYRVSSKVEYGYRSLPEQTGQHIFQTEQVLFLPRDFAFKAGGSIVNSSQSQTEWMLMTGLSVPAGKKIKIEPHYYYMHRLQNEHRLLLNINYNSSARTNFTLGAFRGSEKNIKTNITSTVFGLYAYSNFLIKGPLSGMVLSRYEKDAFNRKSIVAAAGLKVIIDTKSL